MEIDEQIDLSARKVTSQLIVRRCIQRGWKIIGFKTAPAIFLIYPPGRDKPVRVYSASPPQMSRPACMIANNKFIANNVLKLEGLPVPEELLLDGKSVNLDVALQFMKTHQKIVVKPLDGSHGHGINVNVTTKDALIEAIKVATEHTRSNTVLLQEQLEGVDVRVVCINYQFVDAMTRNPASVTGDGTHTVQELIEIENSREERGDNYSAKYNTISVQRAHDFLDEQAMSSIPAAGSVVQVVGVSNLGAGGIQTNVKNVVPVWMQELAIEAARALDLPVAGIDFFVRQAPTMASTREELKPVIIEANACPMLAMHEDVDSPEQLALIDFYLDFVASY